MKYLSTLAAAALVICSFASCTKTFTCTCPKTSSSGTTTNEDYPIVLTGGVNLKKQAKKLCQDVGTGCTLQ